MLYIKRFESFNSKIIIGVDIDGTLYDFISSYNVLYKRYFPEKNINTDCTWDWYKKMDYNGVDPKKWMELKKSEIFQISKPYANTAVTLNNIYDFIKSYGYDLYFITLQPNEDSKLESKKWLDNFGFKYDDIIYVDISKDKWKFADILIDDSPLVLGSKPLNKISIKIEHDYNSEIDGDFNINNINNLNIDFIKKAISKIKK